MPENYPILLTSPAAGNLFFVLYRIHSRNILYTCHIGSCSSYRCLAMRSAAAAFPEYSFKSFLNRELGSIEMFCPAVSGKMKWAVSV